MSTAITPAAASSACALASASLLTVASGPSLTVSPARRSSPASNGADGQVTGLAPAALACDTWVATTTSPTFRSSVSPPATPPTAIIGASDSAILAAAVADRAVP